MSNNTLHKLGIDIGSTTVKVAVLDENDNLLFSDYERHFVKETTIHQTPKDHPQGSGKNRKRRNQCSERNTIQKKIFLFLKIFYI